MSRRESLDPITQLVVSLLGEQRGRASRRQTIDLKLRPLSVVAIQAMLFSLLKDDERGDHESTVSPSQDSLCSSFQDPMFCP